MTWNDDLKDQLADLEQRRRVRQTRSFDGPDRIHPRDSTGRALLSFCSNDYLGLAANPTIAAAAIEAVRVFGVGAGASRLLGGESTAHRDLEKDLAAFVGQTDALLFPTGYQTNLGVITALAGPGDLIASDEANHASIVDGCRLARARIAIYPHCEVEAADRALRTAGTFRRRFLITESLFSMDGDRAPLAALAPLAEQHGAIFIVDEAHAIGVTGDSGRGLCREANVVPDVLVGTLGKAFGVVGGFAACSPVLRSILVNFARTFIYTTGLPPAWAAAARTSLRLIASPAGDELRRRVAVLAKHLRAQLAGLQTLGGQDLIVPIVLGDDRAALAAATQLLEDGILAPAVRPPTVPEGTARLRVTLSALHTREEIDRLAGALAKIAPVGGPAPASQTG